jgi:hypothetical protein
LFKTSIVVMYISWKTHIRSSHFFLMGPIIYLIFAVQILLVNLWSPVIFIMFTLSFKIWTSQNNERKGKTVCRNSNHLVPRKYHKRRDFILKLTCEKNTNVLKKKTMVTGITCMKMSHCAKSLFFRHNIRTQIVVLR